MDFLEHFVATTSQKDKIILSDVMDYVKWETNQGEFPFDPQASDDVCHSYLPVGLSYQRQQPINSPQIASSLEAVLLLAQSRPVDS